MEGRRLLLLIIFDQPLLAVVRPFGYFSAEYNSLNTKPYAISVSLVTISETTAKKIGNKLYVSVFFF